MFQNDKKFNQPYDVCVVDIGSPKLGNIGWCYIEVESNKAHSGDHLDDLIPLLAGGLCSNGLILGLEAPLFIPLREDLMLATKARKGEGRRAWSAGAGAQVLTMNLAIMTYLFKKIKEIYPNIDAYVNENNFEAKPGQMMIFEALVSGSDKGKSHMDDAQIMAEYCLPFAKQKILPPSILEHEDGVGFFNMTSASLLRCGIIVDVEALHQKSPIYKPSQDIL